MINKKYKYRITITSQEPIIFDMAITKQELDFLERLCLLSKQNAGTDYYQAYIKIKKKQAGRPNYLTRNMFE